MAAVTVNADAVAVTVNANAVAVTVNSAASVIVNAGAAAGVPPRTQQDAPPADLPAATDVVASPNASGRTFVDVEHGSGSGNGVNPSNLMIQNWLADSAAAAGAPPYAQSFWVFVKHIKNYLLHTYYRRIFLFIHVALFIGAPFELKKTHFFQKHGGSLKHILALLATFGGGHLFISLVTVAFTLFYVRIRSKRRQWWVRFLCRVVAAVGFPAFGYFMGDDFKHWNGAIFFALMGGSLLFLMMALGVQGDWGLVPCLVGIAITIASQVKVEEKGVWRYRLSFVILVSAAVQFIPEIVRFAAVHFGEILKVTSFRCPPPQLQFPAPKLQFPPFLCPPPQAEFPPPQLETLPPSWFPLVQYVS